jgi:hypothetical protein
MLKTIRCSQDGPLHTDQLISLKSSIPIHGHGQGAVPTAVPQHVAAYALHLTAANIMLLATSEKALP